MFIKAIDNMLLIDIL